MPGNLVATKKGKGILLIMFCTFFIIKINQIRKMCHFVLPFFSPLFFKESHQHDKKIRTENVMIVICVMNNYSSCYNMIFQGDQAGGVAVAAQPGGVQAFAPCEVDKFRLPMRALAKLRYLFTEVAFRTDTLQLQERINILGCCSVLTNEKM